MNETLRPSRLIRLLRSDKALDTAIDKATTNDKAVAKAIVIETATTIDTVIAIDNAMDKARDKAIIARDKAMDNATYQEKRNTPSRVINPLVGRAPWREKEGNKATNGAAVV